MTMSPHAAAADARQQLQTHYPVQQLALGDEVWSIQQLLILLEYGVRSAPDLPAALELWGEGISLLDLPWYPQLQYQEHATRLSFLPLQEERPLTTLWFAVQLLHQQLARQLAGHEFTLEWPERSQLLQNAAHPDSPPLTVRCRSCIYLRLALPIPRSRRWSSCMNRW